MHLADQVTIGGGHVCTLNSVTHTLHCWGNNVSGQLGLGPGAATKVEWATQVAVMGQGIWPDLIDIAAGDDHTCGVAEGGQEDAEGEGVELLGKNA